ncbi:methionyl-tRNA formyltransferase [Leptogranulimonas caecicola]|uniref:Methionyl-tRNA formyltransferase n=1 Tax=Leptogranulimonas caecicola TaxID=2894156 RepID=A0AAU9C3S0_9ACTN|nr:methionyl-tRNA formyltransferase [Leptogranulimonas caecicola]BCV18487.1 methionyl-tRNA formyltransferase [Atopobiaceae bacterium P1]BDC90818.1 methionyl-tRNA formyltransferase [Leptogranulimonas caecicola]
MRVLFMGTPNFAVPSLEALDKNFKVVAAVTRPDAVRGRGKKLVPSPVKVAAQERNIPVIEASRITPEVLQQLKDLAPDVICVAAYGALLPDSVMEIAPTVNVHGSLLPRWRGAAPIQRAILAGDERAGVSIMQVVHELDAGDYSLTGSVEIADKPAPILMDELAQLGADLLVDALNAMEAGTLEWQAQDESLVTYAQKIAKQEMALDPALTAADNARKVQASMDAAPSRAVVAGKALRVMRARVSRQPEAVEPGRVALVHKALLLGCSDGALELLEVKPDGKREMDAAAWARGLHDVKNATWEKI